MAAHSTSAIHTERVLQDHLIAQLVTGQGYRQRDPTTDYDRLLALDKALVLEFIQTTQPDAWARLSAHYSASAEDTFFTQLTKALKDRGLLDVLRQGLKIVPGILFTLCYFKPASALEPKRVAEYESNILSVMKEVAYSTRHANRLDGVLFLNGLPLATFEAKNPLTGTTVRHAEQQYRRDRSPAGEPLLTFKRGALVHFALDPDHVSMTTRLANGKTRNVMLERFGTKGADGLPHPFHLYSMRQAIEEGFILDVLRHYTTYSRREADGGHPTSAPAPCWVAKSGNLRRCTI